MNVHYNVYCISGLAADKKLLQNLSINFPLRHIHWLEPAINESFENYISRLKEQIIETENLVLIGVSFGGMVAISLSKIINVQKTIIISSIKNHQEKPDLLKNKWVKILTPLFIARFVKTFPSLCYKPFGAEKPDEKSLLKSYIRLADNCYLRWSVKHIMKWDNSIPVENLYHIHGTADELFKIKNIQNPIKILGGTHFAVFNEAEEISKIITGILEK